MADSVQTQIIYNGPRNLIVSLVNFSDGTGETLVKKVDAASTTYAVPPGSGNVPGTHLKISRIEYSISGGAVKLYWDATTATPLMLLGAAGTIDLDEHYQIPNSLPTGATGSILLSTVGFTSSSGYTILLHCTKNVEF